MSEGDSYYNGSVYFITDTYTYVYSHGRTYSPVDLWQFDTMIYSTYDTITGVFTNSSRTARTYDANGHNIASLDQNWNTGTSTWDNYELINYQYNAAGNSDTVTYMLWSSGWVNFELGINSYDVNNNLTQQLALDWSGSSWVNNSIYDYNYNAAGYDTLETIFSWSTVTTTWDSASRYIFTYDAQNNETSETDQDYNTPGWINANQYLYANFILPHDPAEMLYLDWNPGSSSYDTIQGILFNYTTDGFILIQQSEGYSAGTFSVQPGNYITRYHYIQDSTVGIAQISADDVKLYPNPTTGTCHLSLTSALADNGTMAITDLTGRMVKTITLSGSETTFQTNDMSTGMYLCTISSGGKAISTKKLMVE